MKSARVRVDKEFVLSEIDDRLYGSFIEHIGRAVYGGLYDPGTPMSDEMGFRKDVLELCRELRVPIVRYPGGNFVSGYNWEDGVGPKDKRPKRTELAWFAVENNQFGTDEFAQWCRLAGAEVMMAVNLGTRGVDAARNLVEYCNHPGGTYWSDLRRQNGYEAPHKIKTWCLGNEMDGPWQIGHKTALEYARAACEAGKAMKWVDPTIELVACGSSTYGMPTFAQWEADVLEEVYDLADYLSLHIYFDNNDDDLPHFLAKSRVMDEYIHSAVATCDHIRGKKHAKKKMMLSFDEWNVWYHSHPENEKLVRWQEGPRFNEDIYTLEDALLVGSMIITLINHSDRVRMACLAQLVNVIAPIMTENGGGIWKQTIYYPYLQGSLYGRGRALTALVSAPTYDTKHEAEVPALDVAAVENDADHITLFAVCKDTAEHVLAKFALTGYEGFTAVEHSCLCGGDMKAVNSLSAPGNVAPVSLPLPSFADGVLEVDLPPLSWNMVRLERVK